jgi:hypothetical protein
MLCCMQIGRLGIHLGRELDRGQRRFGATSLRRLALDGILRGMLLDGVETV